MSEIQEGYFTTTNGATLKLTARQANQVISYLEAEMDAVDREPLTTEYENLWRRVAVLRAHSDRLHRANDAQAWELEMRIRRIRGERLVANL